MTIKDALETSGIDTLDAEVLLAHLMDKDRSWVFTHQDAEVSDPEAWNSLVERRKNAEPVAYIVENQEFYGRDFFVDNRVLIPRPSTEGLVDLVLDTLRDKEECVRLLDTHVVGVVKLFGDLSDIETLVDVGTGSGCIAITLAHETTYPIIGLDISEDALDVAAKNIATHSLEDRIELKHSQWVQAVEDLKTPFLAISNPPYVPEGEKLTADVSEHEPEVAIFSGEDGGRSVVQIYNSLKGHPYCRGVIFECRDTHIELLQ